MVEALQVPVEERFTELMEAALNTSRCIGADRRVEVFNFGISGYGTAQQLMTLRHHVWQSEPDLVILALMTGNDIRNNSRDLQNDDGRPYFVMQNGALVLDDSFRRTDSHDKSLLERVGYAVIDWSRLAQLVYEARKTMLKRRSVAEAKNQFGDAEEDIGLDTLIYREPPNDAWRQAWEVTEALVATMNREVVEHGSRFVVATLSNTAQVNPDAAVRKQMIDKLGVANLNYADDRIREAGNRHGFEVVNLAPKMLEFAEEKRVYLHGFPNTTMGTGHWNAEGHKVVARLLTDTVCAAP
jgi:hypothetical protein